MLDVNTDKVQPIDLNRLAVPVSDIEIEAKIKDGVPKATVYKDKWAVNMFESWRKARNDKVSRADKQSAGISGVDVIENCLLEEIADEQLNRTLALFFCELQKIDSSQYSPNTLRGILASIQLYLKTHGRHVRFFNDDKFATRMYDMGVD